MILSDVTIRGFRSFATSQSLKIERDITVLTGPNDVGKTSILRLLQLFHDANMVRPEDLNVDTDGVPSNPTRSKYPSAFFVFSDVGEEMLSRRRLPPSLRKGVYEIEFRFLESSYSHYVRSATRRTSLRTEVDLDTLPTVIACSFDTEISSIVKVEEPNDNERRLLQVAFGKDYVDALKKARDESFPRLMRRVERDLTKKLAQALCSTQELKFQLSILPGDPLRLSVEIMDETGTTTGLSDRGSGFRKLLTLLVYLFDSGFSEKQVIVLLDEPENSLHADSQHALRYYLERIASHENIQVIYATHSPCMINPVRPRCIRLITREESENDKVTTNIANEPYKDGGFRLIRSSLGLSPADSLLYGAVTLTVEGDTEVLALAYLLERLTKDWRDERPEDLETVLGQIHIVGAGGFGNVHKCALYAVSQGSRAIAFVDGDEAGRVKKLVSRRQQTNEKVPIICIPRGGEIEDLVSQETYVKALSEFISPAEHVTVQRLRNWYDTWKKNEHQIAKFSKRIAKWIEMEFEDQYYRKERVMLRAVELATVDELKSPAIIELIDSIRTAASTL